MNTKSKILLLLEKNRGSPVSGEKIAKMLNISRNAVWKAITSLKNEGYSIAAVNNLGYMFSNDNDILSVAGIISHLSNEKYGFKIYIYKLLESTNKTAKEMAINGAEHGTVIIADTQTEGKGRYDKVFYSPPKSGLYMSIILRSEFLDLTNTVSITKAAAVAVCKAIEEVAGVELKIKPVNDIFLNGKKICGILTEAITDFESGSINWAVVGIGINVNTADFPQEIQDIATSIFPNCLNNATVRNRLAAELIKFFLLSEEWNFEKIHNEYESKLMSS